jgi:hypothetical protein
MSVIPFPAPNELGSKLQSLASRAFSASNVTAPSGITDSVVATNYMVGLGILFTPVVTGSADILIAGNVANSTSSDGAQLQIAYGTGSAPAKNAAFTGTLVGTIFDDATGGATILPFVVRAVLTGLTLGQTIWIDLAQQALVGGAVVFSNSICVQAYEF